MLLLLALILTGVKLSRDVIVDAGLRAYFGGDVLEMHPNFVAKHIMSTPRLKAVVQMPFSKPMYANKKAVEDVPGVDYEYHREPRISNAIGMIIAGSYNRPSYCNHKTLSFRYDFWTLLRTLLIVGSVY